MDCERGVRWSGFYSLPDTAPNATSGSGKIDPLVMHSRPEGLLGMRVSYDSLEEEVVNSIPNFIALDKQISVFDLKRKCAQFKSRDTVVYY